MKTILLAACGLCAIAGPALADELSIRDFVGRIEVVTGDYERIEARVFDGTAAPSPEVRRSGADVEIVGDWDRTSWFQDNGLNCYGEGEDLEIRMGRGERHPIADYPLIQVTAPRDVLLDVEGAILFGGVGDIGGGEIGHAGCGDLTIESVTGDLRAAVAGSGRMAIGDIGGSLSANIAGSGLVQAGDIAGDVDGSIAGSGDVEMGRVNGDMELSIAGSGAFRAAAANGNIQANIAGSGDMDIGGGNAGEVRVRIMGSGNFTFTGEAAHARVNTAGSGDVEITRAADADVHVAGSGDVRVNGVRMR